MRTRFVLSGSIVGVLLAFGVLAAACGGQGDEPELTTSASGITEDDLETLVLTKEELGERFREVRFIRDSSGVVSNDELLDPAGPVELAPGAAEERRKTIEERGRLSGYRQRFQGSPGVLPSVGINVELFKTADGAAASLGAVVDEEVPETRAQGWEISEFETGDIGDEAVGLLFRGDYISADVAFRKGEIFVRVLVTTALSPVPDEAALQQDALEIAGKVADKTSAALG